MASLGHVATWIDGTMSSPAARTWLVRTCMRNVNRAPGFNDWFYRQGWRALWLVATHSLRLWLTAPPPVMAARRRYDGEDWSTDRCTAVRGLETTTLLVEGARSCSRAEHRANTTGFPAM